MLSCDWSSDVCSSDLALFPIIRIQCRSPSITRHRTVTVTAIEIDRIAERLQGKIPNTIKLQKFLDVMHPELRHAIELGINKDKFDWEEIVALAEQHDDTLFQAGKYGKSGGSKKAETFAITQHNQQRTINLKKGQKKTKKYLLRTGNPRLYQEKKQEQLCYFCGKKGHMIADCRQRKQKEQEDRKSVV